MASGIDTILWGIAGAFISVLLSIIAFFLVRTFGKFDEFKKDIKNELSGLNESMKEAVKVVSKIEGDMKGMSVRMSSTEEDVHSLFPRVIELEKKVSAIEAGGCGRGRCGQ